MQPLWEHVILHSPLGGYYFSASLFGASSFHVSSLIAVLEAEISTTCWFMLHIFNKVKKRNVHSNTYLLSSKNICCYQSISLFLFFFCRTNDWSLALGNFKSLKCYSSFQNILLLAVPTYIQLFFFFCKVNYKTRLNYWLKYKCLHCCPNKTIRL